MTNPTEVIGLTPNAQLWSRILKKRAQPKQPPRVQVQILWKKFNERAGTPFHHLKTLEKDA